jgi:hypothetical protein
MPRRAIGVILATFLAPLPQLTPLKLPVLDGPGQRVRLPYCRLIPPNRIGKEDEDWPMILRNSVKEHDACTAIQYF